MFNKIKCLLKSAKGKAFAIAVTAVTSMSAFGIDAFAATGDEVTTSIETSFGNIQTMALTALGALATIAIVLFGGIYAWRYSKKVFTIIAK